MDSKVLKTRIQNMILTDKLAEEMISNGTLSIQKGNPNGKYPFVTSYFERYYVYPSEDAKIEFKDALLVESKLEILNSKFHKHIEIADAS